MDAVIFHVFIFCLPWCFTAFPSSERLITSYMARFATNIDIKGSHIKYSGQCGCSVISSMAIPRTSPFDSLLVDHMFRAYESIFN